MLPDLSLPSFFCRLRWTSHQYHFPIAQLKSDPKYIRHAGLSLMVLELIKAKIDSIVKSGNSVKNTFLSSRTAWGLSTTLTFWTISPSSTSPSIEKRWNLPQQQPPSCERWKLKQKRNPRFAECYTCFGCETKTGVVNIYRLFFKIGLCSAISFKMSRRELSIDVAEHRPMIKKNTKIRTAPVLVSYPKQV